MLLLLCIGEITIIVSLNKVQSFTDFFSALFPFSLFLTLVIVFGAMIGLYSDANRKGKYKLNSTITIKLLSNAIAPTPLGTAYLFFFVIHLGWLVNSSYFLFSIDAGTFKFRMFLPLIVATAGIIFLICFFPTVTGKKDKLVKVFVSGMSILKMPQDNVIEHANIIPLVKILGLSIKDKDTECEMIILTSKGYFAEDSFSKEGLKGKFGTNISGKRRKREKKEQDAHRLNQELETAISILDPDKLEEKVIQTLCKRYDILFNKASQKSDIRILVLKLFIKIFARFEFPEHEALIKKMRITFTEPCDYNNHEECFKILLSQVEKKDDDKHRLYFNLTPGTSVIASVMTLLSIDADRELYYYSQDNNKKIEGRMVRIPKNVLPLQDLLSKALEKISN